MLIYQSKNSSCKYIYVQVIASNYMHKIVIAAIIQSISIFDTVFSYHLFVIQEEKYSLLLNTLV